MRFGGWPKYVPVSERKANMEKLAAKNRDCADYHPVAPAHGTKLGRTWWGKAWNTNLERYADYGSRLGRGRSYVKCNAVLDLKIYPGRITAVVQGSRARPYKIEVAISSLKPKEWEAIKKECEGKFDSLPELLAGHLPQELSELFMRRDDGLFPSPKQISFSCTCPDRADMCKHVAATLYGTGIRLDESPELFFTLRSINIAELVSRVVNEKKDRLIASARKVSSARIMPLSDINSLFGIECETARKRGVNKTEKNRGGKRV